MSAYKLRFVYFYCSYHCIICHIHFSGAGLYTYHYLSMQNHYALLMTPLCIHRNKNKCEVTYTQHLNVNKTHYQQTTANTFDHTTPL